MATLRQILENNAKSMKPINPVLIVENYLEDNDMRLTADDKAVMKDYNLHPSRFMQFSDSQLEQMDEIESAVCALVSTLLSKPSYLKHQDIDIPDHQKAPDFGLAMLEIADVLATHLADAGYTVFFPTHISESDGTEYITDIY